MRWEARMARMARMASAGEAPPQALSVLAPARRGAGVAPPSGRFRIGGSAPGCRRLDPVESRIREPPATAPRTGMDPAARGWSRQLAEATLEGANLERAPMGRLEGKRSRRPPL